jgi:hypothetical protein
MCRRGPWQSGNSQIGKSTIPIRCSGFALVSAPGERCAAAKIRSRERGEIPKIGRPGDASRGTVSENTRPKRNPLPAS